MQKMLLELPHEDAELEALHLHGESEQLKIGLLFSLSELPKQNFFQKIGKVDLIHCRHRLCLKCPEGLA